MEVYTNPLWLVQGTLTEGTMAEEGTSCMSGKYQEIKSTVQHWNVLLRVAMKPPSL